MSFQGDVAGIGLGELLQGLARGGRDGVLNLFSDKVSGCLGVRSGMLYLMPGPDEDEERWRERSLRAWAQDPKPLMETRRREAIARAERLETFYRMLETDNLHFRFEPGQLPALNAQDGADEPYGQGLPVEYMLLEHARLSDEGSGSELVVEMYDIPRAIDPSRYPPDVRDFLEQCEGRSTLLEIADRLGWPLRQCRLHVLQHYKSQAVRLAQPRELLASAQNELEGGHIGRAASRLTGWVRSSLPGPLSVGDAELFVAEWNKGRLGMVLAAIEPCDARAILRKLDRVHADPLAALARWRRVAEEHRGDEISQLHASSLQLSTTEEPDSRTFTDLLRLARSFQENGHPSRTRTLLRLASYQLPAKPKTRIELGRRMMDTGLVEEGARWLLDVARELIDATDGERAMSPLRTVLKKMPDHTEAHGLLIEARGLVARQKRRRWKSIVIVSVAVILSLSGAVHLKFQHDESARLDEIEAYLAQPDRALELLNEHFPDDSSERVGVMRATVNAAKKKADDQKHDEWIGRYEEIQQECQYGDPLLGLRRTLGLSDPPEIASSRSWPSRMDILNVLTARIETRQKELNVSIEATIEELHAEERLQSLLGELIELSTEHKLEPEVSAFHFRLEELHEEIVGRRVVRAEERSRLVHERTEVEQDMLLGAARAHEAAGDLERAVTTYERLSETDGYQELAPLLSDEIDAVSKHWAAEVEAVSLAASGDHAGALAVLEDGCPRDPGEHLLPWKVTSFPEDARATFPNGESRVAPFVTSSSPGERFELQFERDGFESRRVTIENPADLLVYLHRGPERFLASEHRVQALPVPVGNDHIVADRKGRVLRLDEESNTSWTRVLDTLGGIARTPVFLPRKPGYILVVSEDGRAWLVDTASGRAEGPVDLESPPKEGPALTRQGVWLRLEDDRIAIWNEELKPTYHAADSSFLSHDPGTLAGEEIAPNNFSFLRSTANGATRLTSPEAGWTIEVRESEYLITDKDGRGFTARRNGEWSFVAWEAPKALLPRGRLWVSDADGLRSYRPDQGPTLDYR